MNQPTNSIQKRVSDFLQHVPPFSFLDSRTLESISSRIHVQYFAKNEIIFHTGAPSTGFAYTVKDGSVELFVEQSGEQKLIDICDEGDIFGMASLLTKKPYLLSARAAEDTMVYSTPFDVMESLIDSDPKVSHFFASGFASGIRDDHTGPVLPGAREEDVLVIPEKKRDVVHCAADTTIKNAAIQMSRENVGSILITEDSGKPLGIITDTDLRKKVVTGNYQIEQKVSEIMSSPVQTIASGLPVASIILMMMNQNIRHLCITEDGTPNTRATGIISEHDVLVLHGNNPAVLVKEIYGAKSIDSIASIRDRADQLIQQYLEQEIAISFVASIITEINDAMIHQCIKISEEKLTQDGFSKPDVSFAWLSLGSEGRKEQLLRTDQDNAILYDDPEPENEEQTKKYFLALAKMVNDALERIGFERCPSLIMAKNPEWCNPLSRWKEIFGSWIRNPDPGSLMHSTIFFDFRTVYGDSSLEERLEDFIFHSMEKEGIFLPYLARNALQNPPPLSFFRNFIVEASGEHKNEFDIKLRAMMPLADAARVLALDKKIHGARGTMERFEKLAQIDPDHAKLATEAASAYALLVRFRAKNGIARKNSGRYILPESLSKLERHSLRNAFATIQELQTVLKVRYQLDYLH